MVANTQLVSRLEADGRLIVELRDEVLPEPTGHEVLVRIEAAPINPSDLGLLFGPADLANAEFTPGRIVAQMPEGAVRAMAARHGQSLPVGNEGAGTVVAAGDAPEAQALLGKVIAVIPGARYAHYRLVDARAALVLPEGTSAEQGAAAFVNPLTALSFVEAMRREGHKALVHTAAASNLGQMLVKICQADGVPLVNIVRSDAQVALLKGIGAEYVVNSASATFHDDLVAALDATGATLGFDAIGGGKLAAQILAAMEQVASKNAAFSRYGSDVFKKVYLYGMLDTGPTIINRTFGFSWSLTGFLLTPFLAEIGAEAAERLRQRVRDELTTTFASHFKAHITLEQALTREIALAYNARATGEKYLITPHG
jgi:NADPH:quinone reductase-like Zn-dependent oxidoreductase